MKTKKETTISDLLVAMQAADRKSKNGIHLEANKGTVKIEANEQ